MFEELGLCLDGVINIKVDLLCFIECLSGCIINCKIGEIFYKVFNLLVDYKEEDYY